MNSGITMRLVDWLKIPVSPAFYLNLGAKSARRGNAVRWQIMEACCRNSWLVDRQYTAVYRLRQRYIVVYRLCIVCISSYIVCISFVYCLYIVCISSYIIEYHRISSHIVCISPYIVCGYDLRSSAKAYDIQRCRYEKLRPNSYDKPPSIAI